VTDHHHYQYRQLGGFNIVTYNVGPNWKIAVSDGMLTNLVKYFHNVTAHIEGQRRLEDTLSQHFYHPKMGNEVRRQVAGCALCQELKRGSRQYGRLAPRQVPMIPWQEIHTDCIGPWVFKIRRREYSVHALTTIDPVTHLIECNRLTTQTSAEVARTLENNWLARYPRPARCIHDQGSEFMGPEFQNVLRQNGISSRPTTARNPQGNSIIERIHQSVGQVIRALVKIRDPQGAAEAYALVDEALATTMHATRCASSGALKGFSPGAVAFHRDMHLDIPLVADILTIQAHRQQLVDQRLLAANQRRIDHDFAVNELILKKNILGFSDKLKPAWQGPYPIERVHTNGTVTIRLTPNATERINIRRIKPFVPAPP